MMSPFISKEIDIIGRIHRFPTEPSLMRSQTENAEDRHRLAVERKSQLAGQERQLALLHSTTQKDFLSLPKLVSLADSHLDCAEFEFTERAFGPFWDEVEHAANELAAYHVGVGRVRQNAMDYNNRASKMSIQVPQFLLPEGRLPDARLAATRLLQVVRRAQKDFQFATIYEQRKTNQLLYTGFGTLGAAIYSLGSAISASLQELSDSVHSSLDDLLQATRDNTDMMESISERQAEALNDFNEAYSDDADERRRFEESSLESEEEQRKMLDNIQRKRKPFP